ncbi:MAG: acyl carrier protein [Phyllobacteriaceae bacterium]|nr:acyl carrier protein [Phyllobacteriaceae bacterium]
MTEAAVGDEELRRRLLAIVAEEGMVGDREITPDQRLDELGIESADFVMILMAVEEKFGVYVPVDERLTEAKTVGELLDVVCRHIEDHRMQVAD